MLRDVRLQNARQLLAAGPGNELTRVSRALASGSSLLA